MLDAQEMGLKVIWRKQVVPAAMGRETAQRLEGQKAHLAQITQIEAWAAGGRIWSRAKRQSPAPRPRLDLNGAGDRGRLVSTRTPLI